MAQLKQIILLITFLYAYQICGKPSHPSTIVDCSDAINDLIAIYLRASHSYLAMEAITGNNKNDLSELKAFFRKQSNEKRETAIKLMDYQNMRDSKVYIHPIKSLQLKSDADLITYEPYDLENRINKTLQDIYTYALDNKAYAFANYLSRLMESQILIINKTRKLAAYLDKQSLSDPICPTALEKLLH